MKASLVLLGGEWNTCEALCSAYGLGGGGVTEAILAYFSGLLDGAECVGASPADYAAKRLFDADRIRHWISSCQERVTEMQLQLNSLTALQRLIWTRSGADPEALPVAAEYGSAAVEKCRIYAGTGMDAVKDVIMSISSGPLPKACTKTLRYEIPAELEAKLRGLCKPCKTKAICGQWIRTVLDLYASGIASCSNSVLSADLDALCGSGERLLNGLRELHVNLERLSGRIEAASKEMAEANTQSAGLEQ